MDVWVKKADGTPVVGKVWPADPVYFPDYSKNATKQWWITLIKEFHDLLEYDGLWIVRITNLCNVILKTRSRNLCEDLNRYYDFRFRI
jgi:hypothetical protein